MEITIDKKYVRGTGDQPKLELNENEAKTKALEVAKKFKFNQVAFVRETNDYWIFTAYKEAKK